MMDDPNTLTDDSKINYLDPKFQRKLATHSSIVKKEHIYGYAFTREKKLNFVKIYKKNGMRLYRTMKDLNISCHTINAAIQADPEFRHMMREVENEYVDQLEAKSRDVAMTDKGFMDRIAQLRALKPNRYARNLTNNLNNISITIDSQSISEGEKRVLKMREAIEAEVMGGPNDGEMAKGYDTQAF